MSQNQDIYAATVLELFDGPDEPLTIDLRQPVSASARARLRRAPGVPFAIVTACNPLGRVASDAENETSEARLEEEVRGRGYRFLRADGRSPDGTHRERGIAIDAALAVARELALRFEQEAYYWFDGESFWIMGARSGLGPVRLPVSG